MPPKQEVDDSKILDERQAWIERAVRNTFRVSEKDTKKLLETEDYRYVEFSSSIVELIINAVN